MTLVGDTLTAIYCPLLLIAKGHSIFHTPPHGRVNPKSSHIAIFRENPRVALPPFVTQRK